MRRTNRVLPPGRDVVGRRHHASLTMLRAARGRCAVSWGLTEPIRAEDDGAMLAKALDGARTVRRPEVAEERAMNDGWIVVVEDNPVELRLVQVLLAAAGYEVRTARDTKTAAQLLTVFPPRLMLVDFELPASKRIEYVTRLKASPETRDVFIIAMTRGDQAGAQGVARSAGCSDCIAKPIDAARLLEMVARRLMRRSAQR